MTSDYLEQTMFLSNGGIRMSPRELREKLKTADKGTRPTLKTGTVKPDIIESHIKPDLLEKLEELRRGKFQLDMKVCVTYN